MRDLTKRSLLKNAGYNYIMTNSPDARGIDVALMYDPFAYKLVEWHGIRVIPLKGMRPPETSYMPNYPINIIRLYLSLAYTHQVN
jgi:hypothetical protein